MRRDPGMTAALLAFAVVFAAWLLVMLRDGRL